MCSSGSKQAAAAATAPTPVEIDAGAQLTRQAQKRKNKFGFWQTFMSGKTGVLGKARTSMATLLGAGNDEKKSLLGE